MKTPATALLLSLASVFAAEPPRPGPNADIALEWLRFGNDRHAQGKHVHWHQSPARRLEVSQAERPHAVILTCSDSRVPPELIFDQGLGDVYVIRVAGHVAGPAELASIEHAVRELGVPLVVVLGHQRCDIVRKAVQGGAMPGHLGAIVASLSTAVSRVASMPGDTVDHAVRMNIEVVTGQLRESEPVIAPLVRSRSVKVAGAYYRLDSGQVEWTGASAPVTHHLPGH